MNDVAENVNGDVLSPFKGQMLKEVHALGEATAAQICNRMVGKLDKNIKYQYSTVMQNLDELLTEGYLNVEIRSEGDLKTDVKHYQLTDKGVTYIG